MGRGEEPQDLFPEPELSLVKGPFETIGGIKVPLAPKDGQVIPLLFDPLKGMFHEALHETLAPMVRMGGHRAQPGDLQGTPLDEGFERKDPDVGGELATTLERPFGPQLVRPGPKEIRSIVLEPPRVLETVGLGKEFEERRIFPGGGVQGTFVSGWGDGHFFLQDDSKGKRLG
jgi:hypothetical protein